MTTYTRKYYLIRAIKAAGFDLQKSENERMILIPLNMLSEASQNKYITELTQNHGYGAQIVSSLTEPQKLIEPHELIAAAGKIVNERISLWKRFRNLLNHSTMAIGRHIEHIEKV